MTEADAIRLLHLICDRTEAAERRIMEITDRIRVLDNERAALERDCGRWRDQANAVIKRLDAAERRGKLDHYEQLFA